VSKWIGTALALSEAIMNNWWRNAIQERFSTMKKILMAGLLVTTMVYNVGCETTDVAAGVIAVGIGIGIAGMADDHDSNHQRDNDRWERDRRDHDRRDHGSFDRDQRRYERCRDGFCNNAADVALDNSLLQTVAVDFANESFAQKHGVQVETAAKIQKAFANVGKSGLASFEAIGLNEKALDKIVSREMPESAAFKSMALKLNLSEAKAQALLQSLVSEFQEQATDSQSPYWQSCLAKGQWKTPQNAFCSNESWNGCSLATGATLCY
jgi:hypothetical protein